MQNKDFVSLPLWAVPVPLYTPVYTCCPTQGAQKILPSPRCPDMSRRRCRNRSLCRIVNNVDPLRLTSHLVRELVNQLQGVRGGLSRGDWDDEREKQRNGRSIPCPQRFYEIELFGGTNAIAIIMVTHITVFFSTVSFLQHLYPQCLAQTRDKMNAYWNRISKQLSEQVHLLSHSRWSINTVLFKWNYQFPFWKLFDS